MKKETRPQAIKRLMKLSKKDLVIMYLNSKYAFDQLVKTVNKKS